MITRERLRVLEKAAKRLPKVEPCQFDMKEFVKSKGDKKPKVGECGTVACFAGWIPTLVPKCGLRIVANRNEWCRGWDVGPAYGRLRGWDAIAQFFGAENFDYYCTRDSTGVVRLFVPRRNPKLNTPKAVSERALKWCAKMREKLKRQGK